MPIAYAASPAAQPNVVVGTGYGSSITFGSPSASGVIFAWSSIQVCTARNFAARPVVGEQRLVVTVDALDLPLHARAGVRLDEVVAGDRADRVRVELDPRLRVLVGREDDLDFARRRPS